MLKGKLDIAIEIAAVSLMVAAGTFVWRRALKTDFAQSIAHVPFLGLVVSGPQAVMDEAYSG